LQSITLIGNNGSGKSTFIGYLVGLYNHINHHPFLTEFSQHISPLRNQSFGYAPEVAIFESNLTANDLIIYVSKVKKININSKEILNRVGLEISPDKKIREYSKGMRQRLSLALADIGSPEYLVLDEPTSGLDWSGEKIVINFLDEVKKRSKLIISTHSIRLAFELKNEIWLFKSGKIVKKWLPKSMSEIEDELRNL
jgi:ABC-2 type transport system ATP-binding protein